MDTPKQLLRALTNKQMTYLLTRGNESIQQALAIAKKYRRKRLLIPDQGGWLTYKEYAQKEGYNIEIIPTSNGVFGAQHISGGRDTALLFNSMPAYAFNLPLHEITEACKDKYILMINDATASIGTPAATIGDIIIGSFGKTKPVPLGTGGFLAADVPLSIAEHPLDKELLSTLLTSLPERRASVLARTQQVKEALKEYEVLYPEHEGYNVVVTYKDEQEKETLINLITRLGLEHTVCPREIRVNCNALSIEVKRLFTLPENNKS